MFKVCVQCVQEISTEGELGCAFMQDQDGITRWVSVTIFVTIKVIKRARLVMMVIWQQATPLEEI